MGVMLVSPFLVTALTTQTGAGAANSCVAPQSTAWVVDSGNNRVLEFVGPFFSGMSASVVLGQPNFVSSGQQEGDHGGSVNASTLSSPTAMAMDAYGNVWVADSGNNRVLEFSPPFYSGMPATTVLGQSSFTSGYDRGNGEHQFHTGGSPSQTSLYFPTAIAIDSSGDIWVADQGNNRIVEFQPTGTSPAGIPQYTNGEAASLVLGASDFNGHVSGDQRRMQQQPGSLAFDSSGNLWVSDTANNRILEYVPPFTNGMAASVAIGQPTLTTVPKNGGEDWGKQQTTTNQSRLNTPTGIAFDADGNLWVADSGNNRILEFTSPLTTDMLATKVLGQSSSFTGYSKNHGEGEGDNHGFFSPGQIAFDSSGSLWVSDAQNNRIVVFPSPLWDGSVATMVIGQPSNFQTTSGGVGQNDLNDPNGILMTAPAGASFKLAWIRQIDATQRSTMFVTAPPSDGLLSHAFVALAGTPSLYVVRVSDGTVLYQSQAFNVQGSQYGLIPNQQFTLSGLGVPVASYDNSYNVAWVTTGGRTPTPYWLFISATPVDQLTTTSPSAVQAISLNNLRDPLTGTLVSLNPVSLVFTGDGTYLIVGGTNGYVAAFVRSCSTTAKPSTSVTTTTTTTTTSAASNCVTVNGAKSGDSAQICNVPQYGPAGSRSFNVTVVNLPGSKQDIASVSVTVGNGFTSPSAKSGQACVTSDERQSATCSGWAASVSGGTITWTALTGTHSDNTLEPNDLDRGDTGTFGWSVNTPSTAGTYTVTVTVSWVGGVTHDSFPVSDTATGAVSIVVASG